MKITKISFVFRIYVNNIVKYLLYSILKAYRILGYQGASRPSSISTFNCCSILQHFLFDETIIKNCKFTILSVCLFVSNKRQNGWTDRAQMDAQNYKKLFPKTVYIFIISLQFLFYISLNIVFCQCISIYPLEVKIL